VPDLPKDRVAPEDHLRRVLGDWVVEVDSSANLVVIRTPPGSAHVVASALDRAGLAEILGTVAGDDTILAVAAEKVGGRRLAEKLSALSGL
jgi:transcriptional regulator of arginine metabolism